MSEIEQKKIGRSMLWFSNFRKLQETMKEKNRIAISQAKLSQAVHAYFEETENLREIYSNIKNTNSAKQVALTLWALLYFKPVEYSTANTDATIYDKRLRYINEIFALYSATSYINEKLFRDMIFSKKCLDDWLFLLTKQQLHYKELMILLDIFHKGNKWQ